MAAMAFFKYSTVSHLTLGVLLLLYAAGVPKLSGDDTKHIINVGTANNKIAIKGNARTALLAGGLAIICGSIVEMILAAQG